MALAACATDEPGVPSDSVRLASRTLVEHQGSYDPYHDQARLLIHDADAWEQHWTQIVGDGMPAPAVDFSREMIVLAAMGMRSSSGYDITVEGVFEHADGLYIQVRESSPGQGCGVFTIITAPVVALAVPRTDGPVYWVELTDTIRC
jgi:hypothetical protein